MKKMLVAVAGSVAALLSGPALADIDEGRVTQITSWSISLDRTHQFFTVGDPVMIEGLKPGDRVRVTYFDNLGEFQVVKIEKAPSQ